MEKNFKEEIDDKKNILKKEKEDIETAIDLAQKAIKGYSNLIGELKIHQTNIGFTFDIYSDLCEEQIKTEDKKIIVEPLTTQTEFAGIYSTIRKNLEDNQGNLNYAQDIIEITTPSSASVSLEIPEYAKAYPGVFPTFNTIIKKYTPIYKENENITYIKTQLKRHFPQISIDFETFLSRINAFDINDSTYFEFIGFRSMFFYKMIFDNREDKNLYDTINEFVYGKNPNIDVNVQTIISSTCNLWNELSNQSYDKPSVKLGNTDIVYLKNLYRRILGNFASILKAREKYHK